MAVEADTIRPACYSSKYPAESCDPDTIRAGQLFQEPNCDTGDTA
jgi:hypothetical protein